LQVVTGGIGSRAARAIIVANRATGWQQQEAADGDDLAFRSDTPQVPAESRRGSGFRSAHHLRPHDRSDANAICEFLGRSYTAAQDAAFFKPFTAATGIQIRTVTPVAYGKIKAQVQSRTYEFDMTSVNSMQWLRASREGLASRSIGLSSEGCAASECRRRRWVRHRAKYSGTALCYRSDKYRDGGPARGRTFWDVKRFPGNRSLCLSDSPANADLRAARDGVPRDRLYPLDIDRAFEKLDQIKPHVKVWWREGPSRSNSSATARST
jgi:hypothetical protein